MSLVPLGLWLAIVGYGIAYAGMGKLGGDPSYSMGKAFRGIAPAKPSQSSNQPTGTTAAQAGQAQLMAAQSTIGPQALAA